MRYVEHCACIITDVCNLCIVYLFYREEVQKLVRLYFEQLTQGCGAEECTNSDCANGKSKPMEPSEAAAVAVILATKGTSRLCSRSKSWAQNYGSVTAFTMKWNSILNANKVKETVSISMSVKHTSHQLTR